MISCISFTANGTRLNRQLGEWFQAQGIGFESVALARYAGAEGLPALEGSYKDWVKEKFPVSDCLIFISASGIAVRGIAPYVKDKKTDPAVLVIDEQGKFVISLLSGHIGGANEMTAKIASFLEAIPVITTGTDVNHTWAVDVFATKNQLQIEDMHKAKELAAWIIDKKPVWFYSDLKVNGALPGALKTCESYEELIGASEFLREYKLVYVGWRRPQEDEDLLTLTPRCVHLGIGCKKDTPYEKIEALLTKTLEEENLSYEAIVSVASIDLKKDEAGLIRYCREHGLPFHVYKAEELSGLEGDFTPSRFVGSITGVDNVCERAAAYDAICFGQYSDRKSKSITSALTVSQDDQSVISESREEAGDVIHKQGKSCRILRRKTAQNGVTVAIAIEDRSVYFE